MSIYRQNVPVEHYQEITAGRIISVAPCRSGSSGAFDLWYENDSADTQGLYVFGTGHPTPWDGWTRHAWNFIGTVVTPSDLVWHVYTGPIEGEAIAV